MTRETSVADATLAELESFVLLAKFLVPHAKIRVLEVLPGELIAQNRDARPLSDDTDAQRMHQHTQATLHGDTS